MTDQSTHANAPSSQPDPRPTAAQALALYDARMRGAARAAGAPTDRTACAGMVLGGALTSVVFTGGDAKIYVRSLRRAEPPVLLDYSGLRSLLVDAYDLADPRVDQHSVVVFADTDTLRRVAKMSDSWVRELDTAEARGVARMMSLRTGLPGSAFTPVLTECLASRYWLPSGAPTDDLAAWDAAFGHGREHDSHAAFSYLISRALDGVSNQAVEKAMLGAERWAITSAQYGSDHAACSSFTSAGTVADAHAARLALDPTLRERNVVAGSVSKVRIHQIKDNKIEAYLDNPGSIREGSKVCVFDGFKYVNHVEVTLRSVEYVNGELMAVLSTPSSKSEHGHIIEAAKKNYLPLFIAPAPFLLVRKSPKNQRWTRGAEDVAQPRQIEIPLDIALAGALVGD